MRDAVSMKRTFGTHRDFEVVVATVLSRNLCARRSEHLYRKELPSRKIDNYLADEPEIAGNHIGDPGDVVWKFTAGRRHDRNNEQIGADGLHKIRRGESSITTNAARFDWHVGCAGGEK